MEKLIQGLVLHYKIAEMTNLLKFMALIAMLSHANYIYHAS